MKEYVSHETFTNNEQEKIIDVAFSEPNFGNEPEEHKEILKYEEVEAEIDKIAKSIENLTEQKAYYELIKSNVDKEGK